MKEHTHRFYHAVQRLQMSYHSVGIMVVEVVTRRLFKALKPLFMPQNSNADEFEADGLGLR